MILIIPYHLISRIVTPDYTVCGMNEHGNIIVCLFPFCSYYAILLIIIIVCYTNLALYVTRTGQQMADYMDKVIFRIKSIDFLFSFDMYFRRIFIRQYRKNNEE